MLKVDKTPLPSCLKRKTGSPFPSPELDNRNTTFFRPSAGRRRRSWYRPNKSLRYKLQDARHSNESETSALSHFNNSLQYKKKARKKRRVTENARSINASHFCYKTRVVRIKKNKMGRACSRQRSNARFWHRNLLWFSRAFPSVLKQTPGYISRRRDTYKTRFVRIKKNKMGRACSRYRSNAGSGAESYWGFPLFFPVVRQIPGYISQRRGTTRTLPN